MKKLIIFLILAMFSAVSCGGSKKTENDTDIMPDEDEISDEETDDKDNLRPDEDEIVEPDDADYDEDDPCKQNPCKDVKHSSGCHTYHQHTGENYYMCICDDGYKWNWVNSCVDICEDNICKDIEHSSGECYPFENTEYYTCGCVEGYHWDLITGECVSLCYPLHCESIEHSTGECRNEYSCYCLEGYFWDSESKKCVADEIPDEISDADTNESADTDEENPCDPNPCEGKENTTGECIVDEWYDNMGVVNYFSCVCDERYHSYYWNGWKCTNECEGDPCQYEEHAIADSCSLFDTPTAYECDCEEGYHWAYFDCEQDYEEN